MALMTGKRGLVIGIANERSYAYFIAQRLLAHGAEVGFSYLPQGKMENRVRKAVEGLGVEDPFLEPLDANDDASLENFFEKVGEQWGGIDFLVHSIAFANRDYLKPDTFHTTPRDVYLSAIDTSAYTLLAMSRAAMPLMSAGEQGSHGGSIVCMSYYGGEKVTPGYNVMGVAKAALEQTARYLAYELGDKDPDTGESRNIRVNTISAGPFKTLAGAGVGGMDEMIAHQERKSSLKRCNTGEEVGDTAAYLLSDLSSGVTGETIHVDCGFSIVGV
mgnify:FL=1